MQQYQLKIFDVDGTISPLQADPNTTFVEPDFIKYVIEDEDLHKHSNVILTGREDKRVYKECNNHSIDIILGPVLEKVQLTILSSHGLVSHTYDGKVKMHPSLQESSELIQIIHQKIDELLEKCSNNDIVIEKKLTGICLNANQVKDDQERDRIFTVFRSIYEPLVANSQLKIADEHGSLEIRPLVGKLHGLQYFIKKGILDQTADITFFCDSLGESGTDRELAEFLIKDKQNVVQVLNNKAVFNGVYKSYSTSKELACALLNKQVF